MIKVSPRSVVGQREATIGILFGCFSLKKQMALVYLVV